MHEPQRAYGEQDREDSLGRRVSRFVESEAARAWNKIDHRRAEASSDYLEDPRPEEENAEMDPTRESQVIREPAPEHESRPGDRMDAEDSVERVGLLHDVPGLREQWRGVQGRFVDDPQQAVHEAGLLVDQMLEEIRASVGSQRPSDAMSTEELRMSFQRYREFFQRLLSA